MQEKGSFSELIQGPPRSMEPRSIRPKSIRPRSIQAGAMQVVRRAAESAFPRPSLLLGALGIGLLGVSLAHEPRPEGKEAPGHFQDSGGFPDRKVDLPGPTSHPGPTSCPNPGNGEEPPDGSSSPAHLDRGPDAQPAVRTQARAAGRPPARAGTQPSKSPPAFQVPQELLTHRAPSALAPADENLRAPPRDSSSLFARAPPAASALPRS